MLIREEYALQEHEALARIAEAALAWKDEALFHARACVTLCDLLRGKGVNLDPMVTRLHGPLSNTTGEEIARVRYKVGFHYRHLCAAHAAVFRCQTDMEERRGSCFPFWWAKQALRVDRFAAEVAQADAPVVAMLRELNLFPPDYPEGDSA